MSKTVMIFGAGASIPFFSPPLTTDVLTCAVQKETKWKSLLERYTAGMDSGVGEVHWAPIQCLIKRARNVNENLNFEELIEFIDKYSSYCWGDKRHRDLLNFFHVNQFFDHSPIARSEVPVHLKMIVEVIEEFNQLKMGFFKDKRPLEDDYLCQSWISVPLLFRQMIAEAVEQWNSKYRSSDYCNLLAKQSEFILELQQGDLSVYSFNYDDVLPETVLKGKIPLETGFVRDRFDSVKFLQAPSVLAFLHGHARWTRDDCGIRNFPSISTANSWRLEHLSDSINAQAMPLVSERRAYDFNTFLTTGEDKETAFNRNPYCAYYQRIAHDLLRADTVIIAGYSFRDSHIDRMLLNFLDLQSKNKVLVIDHEKNDIDLIQKFIDSGGFLRRVLIKHNVTSISVTDTPRYKYADQLENTDKNGYGFLCPQIWVYKLGYEKFLSEWQTVLNAWRCSTK